MPPQAVRLASVLEEAEHNSTRCSEISGEVGELRTAISGRAGNIAELQKLALRARQSLDVLEQEDKSIDKTFRRDFGVPDLEEHYELFTKMYKVAAHPFPALEAPMRTSPPRPCAPTDPEQLTPSLLPRRTAAAGFSPATGRSSAPRCSPAGRR